MSSSVCPRTVVQQAPAKESTADCALGKKVRKLDGEEVAKSVMQSTNPASGLESTGPLPNEIFELLNEFWRPSDVMNPEQHMLNGKRRNVDSPGGEEQVEDDKGIQPFKIMYKYNFFFVLVLFIRREFFETGSFKFR